jgi:hypothetical protein
MFQTWTRRRTTSTPPDSGPPLTRLCAATLLVAFVLPACGGHNKTENRIRPIEARLTIVPFPGTPDPAVFLEPVSTTGDLVTVDVKLHNTTGNPIDFDAFTLEFTYDFNLVQIGNAFDVNSLLLGDCNAGSTCDPLCSNNAADANRGLTVDVNGKAHFVMGVAARSGCPTASVTSDTTLVTLGIIAATTIPGPPVPPNDPNAAPGRITLISGAGHGDCEILQNVGEVLVNGQPIPCTDGSAYLTGTN